MNFNPSEFVNNLVYMGKGMLGIAAVMLVIIVFGLLTGIAIRIGKK